MILRNLKSLIRRYPVAVVLNLTGLMASLLAFTLIFLQADYELPFDKCHPTADRVFRADKKGDESLFRNRLPRGFADDIIGSSAHIEAGFTIMPFLGEIYYSVAEDGKDPVGYKRDLAFVSERFIDVFGILKNAEECSCRRPVRDFYGATHLRPVCTAAEPVHAGVSLRIQQE